MEGTTVVELFPSLNNGDFIPVFPNGRVWEILNPDNENNLKSQLNKEYDDFVIDLLSRCKNIDWDAPDLERFGDEESDLYRLYGWRSEKKREYFYEDEAHQWEIWGSKMRTSTYGEKVWISNTASIGENVVIEGPAFIGPNAEIRHGAYIRPYSWISDGAVVGHCTEVKHSILLPGAKAPHFNYVGDSILGTGVNLGAGCKLSNLRNDGRNILIRDGETGELLEDSGLRKFGAILGEGVQLGCNVVTNPGTIMEKNSGAWPNVTVSGLIKSSQTVKE